MNAHSARLEIEILVNNTALRSLNFNFTMRNISAVLLKISLKKIGTATDNKQFI